MGIARTILSRVRLPVPPLRPVRILMLAQTLFQIKEAPLRKKLKTLF